MRGSTSVSSLAAFLKSRFRPFPNVSHDDGQEPAQSTPLDFCERHSASFNFESFNSLEVVMKPFTYQCLRLFLLSFMTAATCFAQFSGGVQGTVQDASSAAVPKATVLLTTNDTKVYQEATTDDSGIYRFVSLAPGLYMLSASAPGFSSTQVSFTLTTAETRNVPIKLAVGQAATTIDVSSQAPLLDTSDSRNEQTLDTEALQSLPLAARNPTA